MKDLAPECGHHRQPERENNRSGRRVWLRRREESQRAEASHRRGHGRDDRSGARDRGGCRGSGWRGPAVLLLPGGAKSLKKLWADQKYRGAFIEWIREGHSIDVEVVKRDDDQKGFVVLPRRWVVERALAWLMRYRRQSKDYERYTEYSKSRIYIASIHILLKRLCPDKDVDPTYKEKAA